ncbi:PLP-dependent cysteine synthase family protein [Williamsia maris]|uniref:Pyridoxal-phosphate dependent enzyme n=1 Tax=Williamsia maris TaxID=72806 RepID=A0ABT1HI02_9NOCA|nr:pyridoxal-phosphate dependent enzyme [Williamsia maris]MCP2176805.1 Pyridoxal-phosphate dependent enzyme [Williamsia maris]
MTSFDTAAVAGVYESVADAIGNTPLVRLRGVTEGIEAAVYVKLEFLNPGGSVKDRAAVSMIDAAERDGSLRPGGTVVEGTSGNTGIGLTMVAAARGYRSIVVVPDKTSVEKIATLRAHGADVRSSDLDGVSDDEPTTSVVTEPLPLAGVGEGPDVVAGRIEAGEPSVVIVRGGRVVEVRDASRF